MLKILFVCTGNTCRSPMAEGLFNKLAGDRGMEALALSCGLACSDGNTASAHAIEVMKKYGVDISNHRSACACGELLTQADRIYTMTRGHLEHLKGLFGGAEGTSPQTLLQEDVDDPFMGPLEEYERAAEQIYKGLVKILDELEGKDES